MSTLDKRLVVLEQAARSLAAQSKPHTSSLTIEDFHRIVKEIKAQERPVRTPEEQRAHFEACFKRMQANDELRHERD